MYFYVNKQGIAVPKIQVQQMTKVKNQPLNVPGAGMANEEKNNVKCLVAPTVGKDAPVQIKQETELLKSEVLTLKQKLAKIPESFEARTNYFLEKRELVRKYKALEHHKGRLQELTDNLEHEAAENEFESENFKISVTKKESYRDEEAIKISNPIVIREVIFFLIERLEDRMQEYKAEIEA